MVVTVAQLAGALRLGDGTTAPVDPLLSILNRYLGIAQAVLEMDAPDAPTVIADEATIRFASYLYDAPPAPAGQGFANAWKSSGAASLVQRWRVIRITSGGG